MSQTPKTLAKSPSLKPAEDFQRLRQEGIALIEQMAGRLWTDYNTHDPGITLLEALCYAITDLAYRAGWDIKDLLAPARPAADPARPFPNQAFFTAREILTVNPTTPEDFRRLLIDLEKIRNAWVFPGGCACGLGYYAWYERERLTLAYEDPGPQAQAQKIVPAGLYEVLLELESDPVLGDLADRKIEHTAAVHDEEGVHPVIVELRFPEPSPAYDNQWTLFLAGAAFGLRLARLGADKTFDVFGLDDEAEQDAYLRRHWQGVFYLDLELEFGRDGASERLRIENAALRLFGGKPLAARDLKLLLEDQGAGGFVRPYRDKLKAAQAAVGQAKAKLLAQRNLGEDYGTVRCLGSEEVAVYAEVEVRPDADIEGIQAGIWFEVEQYFSPPIPFHSLQALLDAGQPVEAIFNGPALDGGFIQADALQAAGLRSLLRVSDIINRLMGIDGVVAVRQLLLTKHDAEGKVVKAAADPVWNEGKPVFDAGKTSASWLLAVSPGCRPKLYLNASRLLFYKNGLPFRARADEAMDLLHQLRGEVERPKDALADKDLSIPAGRFRDPADYFPVQHSLPSAYGCGPAGLPPQVSSLRRAQAKQLQAYLMVFEQFLSDALAQLAHLGDLFSLDPGVQRSYFVKAFDEGLLRGFGDIAAGLDPKAVEAITETFPGFLERRNRFLDHLLARFGEQFSEYTLLLNKLDGKQVALDRLIEDKIAFLMAYPQISRDRAKAFNHRQAGSPGNAPGIKKRISLLLGYPDLSFAWQTEGEAFLQLRDRHGKPWLELDPGLLPSVAEGKGLILDGIVARMALPEAYRIVPEGDPALFRLELQDEAAALLGWRAGLPSQAAAQALREELLAWSANERLIVVEHLLLRPKFPGDALYPVCAEAGAGCGDEDPYSFRLSFVMPGWTAQYGGNLEMRRFAERTIQQETPSHLLGKICWVGNDGFAAEPDGEATDGLADWLEPAGAEEDPVWACAETVQRVFAGVFKAWREDDSALDYCGEAIARLADWLGRAGAGENQAWACAEAVYRVFARVFRAWYEDKALDYLHADALAALLKAEFDVIRPASIQAAAIGLEDCWDEVQSLMLAHFRQIAATGWQFGRFERAWQRWLEADAPFDWTEERLGERVEAVLTAHLADAATPQNAVRQCANAILARYGAAFHDWMEGKLKQGVALRDLGSFDAEVSLGGGPAFKEGAAAAVAALLRQRYHAYREVSYRLWAVVSLLGQLRNIYPGATLHDGDDGSDLNPVRLDQTVLGNYPPRAPTSTTLR